MNITDNDFQFTTVECNEEYIVYTYHADTSMVSWVSFYFPDGTEMQYTVTSVQDAVKCGEWVVIPEILVTDNDFTFLHGNVGIAYKWSATTGLVEWEYENGEHRTASYTRKNVQRYIRNGTWVIQTPVEPEIIEVTFDGDEVDGVAGMELAEEYIVSNQIRCNKCGDEIYSAHQHDFKRCKCGAVAVDGGQSYLRRSGAYDLYTEMSIVIDGKALAKVVNAVELASVTGRNSLGLTLAALRGIRDTGLQSVRLPSGNTVWSTK